MGSILSKVVVVAGVPGTGKSTLSRWLARRLNGVHLNLTRFVLEKGIWINYDKTRRSFVIDYEKLLKILRRLFAYKRFIVFDTHWVEVVKDANITPERIIVLRTNPLVLAERLSVRGWPQRKVAENVEAELLGVVSREAIECFGKNLVYEIDTSKVSVQEAVELAYKAVEKRLSSCCIDWLVELSEKELVRVFKLVEAVR